MELQTVSPFKKRAEIAFWTALVLFVLCIPFAVFVGGGQALIATSGRLPDMLSNIIFGNSFIATFILSITNLIVYLWKKFDLSFYVSMFTFITLAVCFLSGIGVLLSLA